ncbi:MAG TPA: exodeoxyribonuclease VII large subunit, partial [Herpetosiphonaceae bacterium]
MQVLSINELTGYLGAVLDSDPVLSDVWVEGEVSNCKRHTSGHWYLTLKEGDVYIDATCWRSNAARLTTLPRDGMAIVAHGRVGLYRGRVQLYIDFIRPSGEGLLQMQLERLKAQLQQEGLFERKRPLPAHPRRIGIVTSPTGAALRDMRNVLSRRYPLAEIILAPAQVQGDGAADTIVEALYSLYDLELDVIIVARGGGSIEDLWSFNEEIVARAVFASPVPLVTGVGHETDTTLVDYVSDLRAPTPSAAAEL